MDPSSRLPILNVVTEAHDGFALHKKQHGRFRRRMFGKLLPLTEAEDHCLRPIILKDRFAQYAVSGWLDFLGEIEDMGVDMGHGYCFLFTKTLEGLVDEAYEVLDELKGELQDAYDNMPEGLQGGSVGEARQEAISQLENHR